MSAAERAPQRGEGECSSGLRETVEAVGGGVGPISKNRNHAISISLKNSFCESHTWRPLS